jgi:hypothetical protein
MLLKACKFRICQWLWTSLLGYIRIIACHLCFVRSISVWVSSKFYMHLIGWHISIFDDVATFLRREMILWVSCRWYSLVSITNFRRVIKSNVYEIKEWNYILRVLVFHLCFIALYILGNNTATPTNHTQGGLCYVLASQTQPIDTKRKSFRLAGKKTPDRSTTQLGKDLLAKRNRWSDSYRRIKQIFFILYTTLCSSFI